MRKNNRGYKHKLGSIDQFQMPKPNNTILTGTLHFRPSNLFIKLPDFVNKKHKMLIFPKKHLTGMAFHTE